MTWPIDDIENRIRVQQRYFAQHNQMLRQITTYSESDVGLTKLLFDSPRVYFEHNFSTFNIEGIEFFEGSRLFGYPLSSKEYGRFIVPVWMMRAYIDRVGARTLYGVITPSLNISNDRINPTKSPPEFHFYIDDFQLSLEGACIDCEPDILLCGIRESGQRELKTITPDFSVQKEGLDEKCTFYVEK